MARAVLITPEGEVSEIQLADPPTLEELQALVEGYIEAVPISAPRGTLTGYINEEGKRGMPYNRLATSIASHLTADDFIVGPMVLLGEGDDAGDDTPAPDWTLQWVMGVRGGS